MKPFSLRFLLGPVRDVMNGSPHGFFAAPAVCRLVCPAPADDGTNCLPSPRWSHAASSPVASPVGLALYLQVLRIPSSEGVPRPCPSPLPGPLPGPAMNPSTDVVIPATIFVIELTLLGVPAITGRPLAEAETIDAASPLAEPPRPSGTLFSRRGALSRRIGSNRAAANNG